jgi:PAS domain S-box-containing protein
VSIVHLASFHDPRLVTVSVIIAVLTSYAALDLAGRVVASRGAVRAIWISAGALAMGIGIWSMHYIGMLAFHLPMHVTYDVPSVAMSLRAAVAASALALWLVSRRELSLPQTLAGSIVMGAGIAIMHYSGMTAMRMQAIAAYNVWLVTLSVLIAIVVSFVALRLSYALRLEGSGGLVWKKLGAAVVMGVAISGMHYTAMLAVRFQHADIVVSSVRTIDTSWLGAGALALSAGVLMSVAILTAMVQRRLSVQATALATSEVALRDQERFLREVIDANPHMIFAKDWDGRFTLANKAMAAVYGTTSEALVGKTDADFNSSAEEVTRFLNDDRQVMESQQPIHIPEEPVTNGATGETRWYETTKVPLATPHGHARHMLGIATDVTQRKHLEEQLRQAQKMEAIGRLAGGIAHDFNNMLTVIFGNVELLLDEKVGAVDSRAGLEEIRGAAYRAAGLTGQLLAFSRKQVLQPRVLDLNELQSGLHSMLSRLIGEDIELRAIAGVRLGAIKADPGQVEQILLNLTANARDAMPRGGTLTIETANVEVEETFATNNDSMVAGSYVLLTVRDTGVGMDAHIKSHLFEPFFTTKEALKGTGLGLATVYGIVKQSGGYITVDSAPGDGATFRIYFPRLGDMPVDKSANSISASPGGRETVLVVEDEEQVRRLTCRVLRSRGYRVLEAIDGDDALRIAANPDELIDLLLTDVVMPRLSGREVAERLLQMRPNTKVLYVSGYTDDAVVRHGVLEASVSFLQKPFTTDSLHRKVRHLLDGDVVAPSQVMPRTDTLPSTR